MGSGALQSLHTHTHPHTHTRLRLRHMHCNHLQSKSEPEAAKYPDNPTSEKTCTPPISHTTWAPKLPEFPKRQLICKRRNAKKVKPTQRVAVSWTPSVGRTKATPWQLELWQKVTMPLKALKMSCSHSERTARAHFSMRRNTG